MTTPDGLDTHYGIPVVDIEVGVSNAVLALGHHPRRTLAAFGRHARVIWGYSLAEALGEADCFGWRVAPRQMWARFNVPHEDPTDWDFDYVDADTPGAVPITILVVD